MFETARLLLRPPVATDAQRVFDIYGDPRTNVYNPFGPHPDIDKARSVLSVWMAHWEQYGFGQWAIATLLEPGKIIGFGGIAFRNYNDEVKLNLGYRFAPEAWGYGYATEVGRVALRCAFEQHRQSDVHAIVRPANTPSIRVLEKLPMKLIGDLDDVPGQPLSLMYWAGNPARAVG